MEKDNSCVEIVSKKRRWIYSDEECGKKAKHLVEYTLNGKETSKSLCGVHLKSVTSWLERIRVPYIKK